MDGAEVLLIVHEQTTLRLSKLLSSYVFTILVAYKYEKGTCSYSFSETVVPIFNFTLAGQYWLLRFLYYNGKEHIQSDT